MDSLTLQQESFAQCLDMDALDDLLVTCTVPEAERFGWTTFSVVARNPTSLIAETIAGAVTTVHMLTTFLSHVSLTRLKQSLWLEEEIHGLDVLKCFMVDSGEPFVMMDSLTRQQELFATLLDSDMSEERWTLASMVWVTD